jgi:hypothetical protein
VFTNDDPLNAEDPLGNSWQDVGPQGLPMPLVFGIDAGADGGSGIGDDGISATTPVGRNGEPLEVCPWNPPGEVDGVNYSGHAFDEMQSDGLTPTKVKDVIEHGAETKGPDGEKIYYDSSDNVSVVKSSEGKVITVSRGQLKVRK